MKKLISVLNEKLAPWMNWKIHTPQLKYIIVPNNHLNTKSWN